MAAWLWLSIQEVWKLRLIDQLFFQQQKNIIVIKEPQQKRVLVFRWQLWASCSFCLLTLTRSYQCRSLNVVEVKFIQMFARLSEAELGSGSGVSHAARALGQKLAHITSVCAQIYWWSGKDHMFPSPGCAMEPFRLCRSSECRSNIVSPEPGHLLLFLRDVEAVYSGRVVLQGQWERERGRKQRGSIVRRSQCWDVIGTLPFLENISYFLASSKWVNARPVL